MKAVYFIGILAFLLFTIGSASATTYYMTETTDDYKDGVPIKVQVDYSDSSVQVKVVEPQNKAYGDYTISNVDLKAVYIKTTEDRVSSVSAPWHASANGGSIGNFGTFGTVTDKKNNDKLPGPVSIQLKDTVDTLIQKNGNYIIAAHVSFDKSGVGTKTVDCSGKVTGSSQIPEFPSMILPVVAIIGIMLIFGRRKNS